MSSSASQAPKRDRREPLLVADAGAAYRATPADPIEAWIDLMETVQALAPDRPRHSLPPVGGDYRL